MKCLNFKSLISTHAFGLSPVTFFVWDMRRVVKWTEHDGKNIFRSVRIWSSNISTSAKFSYSETNQTSFRGHFTRIKKILQNGRLTALSGLREGRPQYILKTRIMELQISFRLRQFLVGTLRKWRLISLPRYFSLTKNSVSDRRTMWMEIRLNADRAKDIFRPYLFVSALSACPIRKNSLATSEMCEWKSGLMQWVNFNVINNVIRYNN